MRTRKFAFEINWSLVIVIDKDWQMFYDFEQLDYNVGIIFQVESSRFEMRG